MINKFSPIWAIQRAICAGISLNADYDCENPIQAGVDQRLILMNLEDIDFANTIFDPTAPYIITTLALLPGKSAFSYEGIRRSLNPQYNVVQQAVSIGYSHQVDFSIFDISPESKENIEAMAVTPTVAIVQNVNDVGNKNNFFEVYGLSRGLQMSTGVRIPADSETAGAFTIQLITEADGAKESKMPATYFDTDFSTTLDKINQIVSGSGLILNTVTVETGSASDIVMTFDKTIVNFNDVVIGGIPAASVVSVTIAGAVVTVVSSATYTNTDTPTISGIYEAADGVLSLTNQVVTNNVA